MNAALSGCGCFGAQYGLVDHKEEAPLLVNMTAAAASRGAAAQDRKIGLFAAEA